MCLNRHLHVRTNLLPALADLLLRWRLHQYVLATDVEMFRQILVDPVNRDLQRIVWRENSEQELRQYRLNTVTYGECSFLGDAYHEAIGRQGGVAFPRGFRCPAKRYLYG